MLPSRGVAFRSISSGRASRQVCLTSPSVRLADTQAARNFSSAYRTTVRSQIDTRNGIARAGAGAGAMGARSAALGVVLLGSGSPISRRSLSLWSRSSSKSEAVSAPAVQTSEISQDTAASIPEFPSETTSSASSTPLPPAADPLASDGTYHNLIPDPTSISNMPEQIGYLKALGLDHGIGPSSMVQWLLEHVYIYTGMPWWATITATTIIIRLLIFKPTLVAQESGAKMQTLQNEPEYAALKAKMQSCVASGDRPGMMEAQQALRYIHKRNGVSPFSSLLGLVQIPFGVGFFIVLRAMSNLPVPSLEQGGLLWFTDLTSPDPLFILPVVAPLAMIAMLRSGLKNSPPQQQAQMKLFAYVFAPISLLVALWLPASVQFYFIITTALGVGQNVLFRNNTFRNIVGLTPLPNPTQPPTPTSTKHISGALYYPPSSAAEPTQGASSSPASSEEPSSAAQKGFLTETITGLKQTVHQAKGGVGDALEEARKKKEKEALQAWNEKKIAEDKRRMRADLKKKKNN